MKKHRLEKFFTSIFGTHADTENSEVQKDNKDIAKDVERILKLIAAEGSHTNSSDDSSDQSELSALINDFYKRYQTLYGRYDHLIGRLKNHVPHKRGDNGSFKLNFSSSDSESSDSGSDKVSSKKKRANKAQDVRAELESKLQEAEKSIEECTIVIEQMKEEITKLKLENNCLKQESESTALQMDSLNQQLISTNEERDAFKLENSIILSKIQEAEKALADHRDEADTNLKLATEVLSSENAELSSMNQNLNRRLEVADQQGADLIQKLATAEEENNALKSEIIRLLSQNQETEETIKALTADLELLRDDNLKLLDIKSDLHQQLNFKDDEINALASEHLGAIDKVRQAQEEIETLLEEIEKKNNANSQFSVNIGDLTLLLEARNQEVSDLKQTLETTQAEKHSLAAENFALVSKIDLAEKTLYDFRAEREQLEIDKSQLHIRINDLGLDLQVTKEENNALKSEISEVMGKLQESDINIKKIENEVEQLREENFMLQQSESKLQEAEQILDDLKAENEQLRSDNSQLLIKINALASEHLGAIDKVRQAQDEIEMLSEEIEKKNNVNSQLSVNCGDLTLVLEARNQEVFDLKQTLESIQAEKHSLAAENFALVSKIDLAEKTLYDFRAEREQLEIDKSQLHIRINDLGFDLQVTKEENNALKSEISEVIGKLQESDINIKKIENEVEQLREENFMLQQSKSKLQEAEQILDDLKAEKEQLRSDKSHLMIKINALASEHLGAIDKVRQAQDEIEMLSEEIEKKNNANSQLSVNYGDLTLVLEARNQEVSDLKQTLEATQAKKHSLAAENFALVSKIDQAEKTLYDFRAEREQLEIDKSQLHIRINDLGLDLQATKEENNALKSEISGVMSKLRESDIIIKKIENEVEQLREENFMLQQSKSNLHEAEQILNDLKAEEERLRSDNSQLMIKINNLSLELEASNVKSKYLQTLHENAEDEKKALNSEISTITSKLQQSEITTKELEDQLERLREDNSTMQRNQIEDEKVIDDLKVEIERLKADDSQMQSQMNDQSLELEAANLRVTELNKIVACAEEEKSTLTSEISMANSALQQGLVDVKDLEHKMEELRGKNVLLQQNQEDLENQNTELGRRTEEARGEVLTLRKELEEVQKETAEQIQAMTVLADDLQMELDLLRTQKSELQERIEITTDELTSKISGKETMLTDQENRFNELLTNYKQLEDRFEESCMNLNTAERKIEELGIREETIRVLESVHAEQNKEISELEESRKGLLEKLEHAEAEKADMGREVARLHEQLQNVQVQIRLSNQKLKITETENEETVENYMRAVESLRGGRKVLEERMLTLSRRMGRLEAEFRQMKEAVQTGMASLTDGVRELGLGFERNYGHMLKKLSGCIEELTIVKTWLGEQLNEKQELYKEKHDLSASLKYQEGVVSVLEDEARSRGAKLVEKDKELEVLKVRAAESERKAEALEKWVKEKEEEVLAKDEEKREAIRQLCLLIEYHRENCNQLYKHLRATMKRSQR